MKKGFVQWLDPILLIGLFISIAIPVILVWVGIDTATGLTFGLLSSIIALLIDLIARLQKAEKMFLDVAGFEQILANPWAGQAIREQAILYNKIYSFKFPHYNRIAEVATSEFQMRLAEIASGEVIVPAKTDLEYSGAIGLNEAQREVKVIHAGQMDFWETPFGKKILEHNRQTVQRKIRFTRIFALTEEEALSSLDILQQHASANIQVLIVDPKRVTSEFIIFDDHIVVEYNIRQGDYRYEKIILEPAKVKRKIQEFDFLKQYARTLKEISSSKKG